jgi:hypothetical protein
MTFSRNGYTTAFGGEGGRVDVEQESGGGGQEETREKKTIIRVRVGEDVRRTKK